MPSLSEVRDFWEQNPIAHIHLLDVVGSRADYFRKFDSLREHPDAEPYPFSNFIHGYEHSQGKKVLDYGCGNGYVLSRYARNGATVCGVDIAESAIELTKERFKLMGLQGTFLQNDGQSIPFESEQFDIACAMGVLMCVPDPTSIVSELHRVLKPGGKIIVMLYNRHSLNYLVTLRLRKYFGRKPYRGQSMQQLVNMNDGFDNPYGSIYSRKEVLRLLSQFAGHKFYVNKLAKQELTLNRRSLGLLLRVVPTGLVSFLARRIGWNRYCIAYKPSS